MVHTPVHTSQPKMGGVQVSPVAFPYSHSEQRSLRGDVAQVLGAILQFNSKSFPLNTVRNINVLYVWRFISLARHSYKRVLTKKKECNGQSVPPSEMQTAIWYPGQRKLEPCIVTDFHLAFSALALTLNKNKLELRKGSGAGAAGKYLNLPILGFLKDGRWFV